ncbi:MAG TPA: hypothetical protein VHL56_05230, partial [Candidatus Limnocylindrales bacterium]|nr:hypothetical protein [Candidatus Limnocylindrales bacterium]
MSSEAGATATREHAPAEEAAPNAPNGTESSNPAAPFSAGARHLAAVRPREVVALQRLAGNAAVSRLVARRQAQQRGATVQRAASVQREGPDVPGAATTLTAVRADKAGTPAEQWTDIKSMGDDPMAKIKAAAALFKATDTLKPNEKYKGDPNAFHPGLMAIVYMDYIVIIDRTGPLDVRDQKDPPLQAPRNVVVLADTANFTFWTLQVEENSGAVRAHHDPSLLMYGVEKGAIGMYAFIPGLFLGADYAADIRKSIKKATDATPAKPGQNPDWAKDQVAKLRKRRGKGAGDGSGLGRQGTGTGGGGTKDDPRAVPGGDGQEKKEGGQGGQSKDPKDPKNPGAGGSSSTPKQADPAPGEKQIDGKAPGDPSAPKPKPLQGDPKYQVITTADGKTHLQITLDHASTWVEMREGENDASLDARIDKAVEKLQESRDPEKHGMVANPVKESGFQQQKGETGTAGTGEDARKQATGTPTNATPGERIAGAKGGANAPAYPATITMSGNNEAAPTTVSGATNHFTMELDYAAMSFGTRDEVFNRMQPINFYWEIFDVTGKTIAEKKEVEKKSGVGAGTETGPGHGAARNLGRAMDNIAEDERADIEMMEKEDWGWDARAAYLTLIGVSNAVRTVGALISSYVDLVTEPLNERAIGLRNTGEFLVRAVATPQLSDTAKADPANHVIRASSVAALAVKVVDINSRAKGSLNEEDSQLAKLEKDVKEAKTDEARKEAQQMLDAAKKASAQGGFSTYTTSVSGLRHRLEVARKLKETYAKGTKSKDMEGEQAALAYALEERNGDVDQLIKQLEGQLKTVAGDDWEKGKGEHETWVAKEAGSFKGGDYRPRVVLASEETGQVTPVQMMLGETKESTTDKPRWQLIDISSAGAREIYHGKSDTAGPTGHALAIRDAFRDFAENNDYGRGSIAIRLPKELTSQPEYAGATVDPLMRSAKGGSGRFKQRLQDLATAAEVVGLFVTGPIGVAVAAAGGIAGAIIAVDSLAKRVRTGHVVEVGTIFDILGVIGGVTSVASVGVAMGNARLGKVLAAGGAKPSWVGKLEKTEKALHIHGVIGNIQQVIVIPMDLIKELDEIGGANTGETNARRALALLRAFKSGWVTVIGMQGGFGGVEKAPKKGEPEIQAPRQLPAGHNADAADAHAAGSGPARPPQQAPLDAGGAAHTPAKPAGNEAAGPGAGHPDVAAATNAKGGVDVTTPSPDAVIAHAQDLARAKVKASEDVVTSGGNPPKPAGTGEGDAAGTGAGAKPGDPGGAKPGEPGAGAAKPAEPGGSGGPKPIDPTKPIESNLANVEKAGPGASRTDALIGILGEHGAEGAKPHEGVQKVRPEATKNAASAQPDAVDAVKATSDFGQLRRDIDNMSNLSGPQRAALSSRLQEARLGVTNEHVGKQLVELQKRFPDLEFHIQDLGTVGFNSDRDITIRVTAKDPAAYAKLGEAERAAMDRQMIVASAEAVPEMYKALEAAGFPPNKSLDTNFYTELHEGRVTPKDAAEATSIAADQQIVSMTEILLNTTHAQWEAYVKQQRDMIEGLRGKKGTPERDIPALKARLEQQIAEAEAHAKRLVGDAGGHPSPDVKNAALDAARKKLVEALKRPEKGLPEPSAREKRQLMADVKLLEPDAYGTRAAVEGVV